VAHLNFVATLKDADVQLTAPSLPITIAPADRADGDRLVICVDVSSLCKSLLVGTPEICCKRYPDVCITITSADYLHSSSPFIFSPGMACTPNRALVMQPEEDDSDSDDGSDSDNEPLSVSVAEMANKRKLP
jgi:hypothetical protein